MSLARSRDLDETTRRRKILRRHVIGVLTEAREEGNVPDVSGSISLLVDRVEEFVVQIPRSSSVLSREYLEEALLPYLSQPVGLSSTDGEPQYVLFPSALAKDLLSAIVLAAHASNDSVFQVAA